MWVAVDCLVFGYDVAEEQLSVLAFPRKVEPFAGQWSLIGGIVALAEDLKDTAKRVLKTFTGLEDVFLEQLSTYGKAHRDPGGRVVSVLYWSLIRLDDLHKETVNSHGARWFALDELPPLVLDHYDMVTLGARKLRENAISRPLGFELLPGKFTLPQLLKLYEAMYGTTLDDRNFRKKILSTGLLTQLSEKDKSGSRKGAFLYEFNPEKYQELKQKGYRLELF